MKRYYSIYEEKDEINIYIYGDIVSNRYNESDVTSSKLSKKIEEIGEEKNINVYINSYGGEVAEGLAIYNALKRYKGKVRTIVDGFACSIASVIFMAGEERIMPRTSLLMIHNAWTIVRGNAKELKKEAENLEKVTEASINVYKENIDITEEKLKELLDEETWINGREALEMGFATKVIEEDRNKVVNQGVKESVVNKILKEEKKENKKDNILEVVYNNRSEVIDNNKYLEENKPKKMLKFLLSKVK